MAVKSQGWKERQLLWQGCGCGQRCGLILQHHTQESTLVLITRSPLPPTLLSHFICRASHGASEPGSLQDSRDLLYNTFSFFVAFLHKSKKCPCISTSVFLLCKVLDSVKSVFSVSTKMITHGLCLLLIWCITLVDEPLNQWAKSHLVTIYSSLGRLFDLAC